MSTVFRRDRVSPVKPGELSRYNAIAPGMTITEGIRNNSAYSKEMLAGTVEMRAIQREETPEDLVGACLFLASDGAAFMTGQILTVDGGTAFH